MNFFLQVITAIVLCVASMRSVHADPPTPPLVTMSKAQFLALYECIAKSPTQALCDGFAKCTVKKPAQILNAYRKCRDALGDASKQSCSGNEHLYTTEINSKIFDCTVTNTSPLNDDEKKQMVEFEDCIKALGAECEASG